MNLIDTHCHLDAAEFNGVVPDLIRRAKSFGVRSFIIPGVRELDWPTLLSLCDEQTGVFAAPGLHPLYLKEHHEKHLEKLETLCRDDRVVAIGEIGLDYLDPTLDKTAQQILFEKQLRIASNAKLPILLHVRKAHDHVLATLRRKNFSQGGIVHAFSGSHQQADQYIQLGFVIGIGGTITYTRANRVRTLAANLPHASLVLETDAPDMSGAAHRGQINLPEYLVENLQTLATLRTEPPEYTASYTTANARRVFCL